MKKSIRKCHNTEKYTRKYGNLMHKCLSFRLLEYIYWKLSVVYFSEEKLIEFC